MFKVLTISALLLLFPISARAESNFEETLKALMGETNHGSSHVSLYSVSEKNGNIFITDKKGELKQLTFSGKDSQPSLSVDEKTVVFVRNTPKRKVEVNIGIEDEVGANEIWTIDTEGKNPKLIVKAGKKSPLRDRVLARLSMPQFSSDDASIYFMSMGTVTSDIIYLLHLETNKLYFVVSDNSLEVIQRGRYEGCLIVKQHKYFLGGGSYDWFWLLSYDGKEKAPLGKTDKNFKSMFVK
ncbi:hypothetical protein KAW08_05790 [bacterium]|nr:hypothetical protein [bacterium]